MRPRQFNIEAKVVDKANFDLQLIFYSLDFVPKHGSKNTFIVENGVSISKFYKSLSLPSA